jgi:hypothetical protein
MEIGEKLKKRFFNIKNACYLGYPGIRVSGYQVSLHKAGLACPDALMC